jgi:hypothetical protein
MTAHHGLTPWRGSTAPASRATPECRKGLQAEANHAGRDVLKLDALETVGSRSKEQRARRRVRRLLLVPSDGPVALVARHTFSARGDVVRIRRRTGRGVPCASRRACEPERER